MTNKTIKLINNTKDHNKYNRCMKTAKAYVYGQYIRK